MNKNHLLAGLTQAELIELADEAKKRAEAPDVVGFAAAVLSNANDAGISIASLIQALNAASGVGKSPSAIFRPPNLRGYVRGVVYQNRNGETWVGGSLGRQPQWLRNAIEAGVRWDALERPVLVSSRESQTSK